MGKERGGSRAQRGRTGGGRLHGLARHAPESRPCPDAEDAARPALSAQARKKRLLRAELILFYHRKGIPI